MLVPTKAVLEEGAAINIAWHLAMCDEAIESALAESGYERARDDMAGLGMRDFCRDSNSLLR